MLYSTSLLPKDTGGQMDGSNGDLSNESSMLLSSLVQRLGSLPPITSSYRIHRVPERLRELNQKAYTPRVVSIGPLHHGSAPLQATEECKLRYLKDFLPRFNLSLEDYAKFLTEREARVRNCYEETIDLGSTEFLGMILMDAAFVIELMLRYKFPAFRNEYDCVFCKRWLKTDVRSDMLMLENQLPYFIFEELFVMARITIPPEHDEKLSLIRLVHATFETKAYLKGIENLLEKLRHSRIENFVHFLRICYLPKDLPPRRKLKTVSIPTVTQLHQAGVKFKGRPMESLCDIRFKDGVLEIPQLRVRGPNDSLFGNLIAFEQCHLQENYITDYFFLMDRLIDTRNDVELLVQNGILESKLTDSQAVVTFINNLIPGTMIVRKTFRFSDLCEELHSFCRIPWHKWKATLKQDYFSTPWAILSIIAAAVLLILTSIQTVCSVISL